VELDLVLDSRNVADSRTPWQRRPDVNDDVARQEYFARLEDPHFGRTSLRRRPKQPMKYFSVPSRNSAKLLRPDLIITAVDNRQGEFRRL
jgi:hypothetical protein